MRRNNWLRRAATQVRFGDLRRTSPVSSWGSTRGTPVDRWYIERYLVRHTDLVRGHTLEVKSDQYASRLGASSVDVVDIDRHNPRATVVGDLCAPGTLRASAYDAAVVTQTLQLVSHPADAVHNLVAALRPGGALLLTVPTLSRIVDDSDRWRWTPAGMSELLCHAVPRGSFVEAVGLGNGLAARAFLFGLAVEDLDGHVLAVEDHRYPLVVGARVEVPE